MPRNRYTANVQALCAVSTLQSFNLIFLELFLSYLKKKDMFPSNKYLYGGIVVVLLFINFLRYGGDTIKELAKKWKNESENQKLIKGFFVTIYIILSIVLFVASADYVGKYLRTLGSP